MVMKGGRKFHLGHLAGVVGAFFGVLVVLFPEKAEYLTALGIAASGFITAIAKWIGEEDAERMKYNLGMSRLENYDPFSEGGTSEPTDRMD